MAFTKLWTAFIARPRLSMLIFWKAGFSNFLLCWEFLNLEKIPVMTDISRRCTDFVSFYVHFRFEGHVSKRNIAARISWICEEISQSVKPPAILFFFISVNQMKSGKQNILECVFISSGHFLSRGELGRGTGLHDSQFGRLLWSLRLPSNQFCDLDKDLDIRRNDKLSGQCISLIPNRHSEITN